MFLVSGDLFIKANAMDIPQTFFTTGVGLAFAWFY